MERRLKRPRDPIALAKLIGDIATGQVEDQATRSARSESAAELGRKGGASRAKNLSKERQKEIAQKAAAARWGKK